MVIRDLLVFLLVSTVHASNSCPTVYCYRNGPIVQFPFWLQGTLQPPQNCAPPGFNLSCNGHIYPILHIPGLGDFYLKFVYYYTRRVTLQDVEGCLMQRLLRFNLLSNSTPFKAVEYRNYTFFSCSKGSVYSTVTSRVECASNATSDVFAMDDEADSLRFSECTEIATVPVPVSSYGFPDNLELTWASVEAKLAVGKARPSEFTSSALILIIPIVFLLFVVVSWVCMKNRNSSSSIQISEDGGLRGRGLDKSTIETYKKITIGESCVEGPNGVACTICLADYAPNEAIRFIPECEHCFHVECIDKWLSMSRKCPICRISLPNTISC